MRRFKILIGLILIIAVLTSCTLSDTNTETNISDSTTTSGSPNDAVGAAIDKATGISDTSESTTTAESSSIPTTTSTTETTQEGSPSTVSSTPTPSPDPTPQPSPSPSSNPIVTSGELKIHFLDVGQADCIFIDYGDVDILIDAGNRADGDLVVSYLNELNTDDLEMVIATHPHEDHIGGMVDVINNFDIERIVKPGISSLETVTSKNFEEAIYINSIPTEWPAQGYQYIYGDLIITVLSDKTKNYTDTNDFSIVVRVDYGDTSFVFTGDAESPVEHDIVASGINIDADVLKVGHHGGATSSTAQFVNNISPTYAVICVGEGNSYGHPDSLIISRLTIMEIEILRTDLNGTIIFTSDGVNLVYKLTTIKEPTPTPTPAPSPSPTPTPTGISGPDVRIIDLDKVAEYIIIKNFGSSAVDMTGWWIMSIRGEQKFYFPAGYTLNASQECKIAGYGAAGTGDFVWEDGRGVWNNSSDDDGALYDNTSTQASYWDDK